MNVRRCTKYFSVLCGLLLVLLATWLVRMQDHDQPIGLASPPTVDDVRAAKGNDQQELSISSGEDIASPIVDRDIFGLKHLSREADAAADDSVATLDSGEAEAAPAGDNVGTLNIALMGTIVGEPRLTKAIIRTPLGAETFRVGDIVAGATIVAINPTEVTVLYQGNEVSLTIGDGLFADTGAPQLSFKSVEELAPDRYSVSVEAFIQELADPSVAQELLSHARIVTHADEGQVRGLRVEQLPDSRLTDIFGLQDGDVILAINGTKVESPWQALRLLNQLLQESNLTVQVVRGGSVRELHYELSHSATSRPGYYAPESWTVQQDGNMFANARGPWGSTYRDETGL